MTHFVGGNLTNNIPAWEQLLKKCGGFHHVLDWVKFGIKIHSNNKNDEGDDLYDEFKKFSKK